LFKKITMKKILSLLFAVVFSIAISFAQITSLEVIDEISSIKFKINGTTLSSYTKSGMTLTISGNLLLIKAANGETRSFDYTKVINPTYASVEAFRVAVAAMLATTPEGSGLTNAELRATPVPVSATSLPLPTDAATLTEQQTQTTKLTNIDGKDFATLTAQQAQQVSLAAIENATNTTSTNVDLIETNQLSGFQLTGITNGFASISAQVKLASTIPEATDPALVVSLSPNGNQAKAINQTNGLQVTGLVNADQTTQINPATNEAVLDAVSIIVDVNNAIVATQSLIGNALPASVQLVGGSDGINLQPFKVATDGTLYTILPSGEQTITSTNVTAGGTVTAGATSVTFKTDATFTGTINGVTRGINETITLKSAEGKTLPAIAYTISVGSISIDKIE
jgi:hypothetical protein